MALPMKMQSLLRIAIPLSLLGMISACNSQSTESAQEDAAANKTAPVELPPMVMASHTYRCKDNSLVKVEFFSDKTAVYYEGEATTGAKLTQAAEGGAYTADGISVSGPDTEITLTAPGKGTQSCKA